MARRRRRRRTYRNSYSRRYQRGIPFGRYLLTLTALAAIAWWLVPDADPENEEGNALANAANIAQNGSQGSDQPHESEVTGEKQTSTSQPPNSGSVLLVAGSNPNDGNSNSNHSDSQPSSHQGQTPQSTTLATGTVADLMNQGAQANAQGDLLAARTYYGQAIHKNPTAQQREQLRTELDRLGQETIFSSRLLSNDPLVRRYTIKPGDSLGKIAKTFKVSAELIANINGIRNVNLIRAGQTIKIIQGPFHALVDKSDYVMEVYLGNVCVKQFVVGLGADDGTPTGKWQVGTKLKNPTYYPPRGGPIVAADDPENPLGERWIALHGISGEAFGASRYGIHGTIEPESIGQSMSLGCVRMHNHDVEQLYTFLVEKHSSVEIVE